MAPSGWDSFSEVGTNQEERRKDIENWYFYECGPIAGWAKYILIFLIKHLLHIASHLRKFCLNRCMGKSSRGWKTTDKSFKIMIPVNSITHLGWPCLFVETMLWNENALLL